MVGGGLLGRSFMRLITSDAGFRTRGVAGDLARDGDGRFLFGRRRANRAPDPVARRLMALARRTPGVTAVGAVSNTPLSGGSGDGGFLVLPERVK